ncbi:MAG: hypothetical protein AAGD22_13620 [Verrucomicrobiota bacterium]
MPTKRRPSSKPKAKKSKRHKLPITAARSVATPRNRRSRKRNTRAADVRDELGFVSIPGLFSVPESIPVTWIKFAIGILLVPLCWITTETFFVSFAKATLNGAFWRSPEFFFFALGSLMSFILFFFGRGKVLIYLYVLGHEWTHAFFALLCGGRVEKVHVGASGGHILTDKNNFLISLSPYFVPFYSVITIGAYAVLSQFIDLGSTHSRVLFALIGLTWTFHLTFTIWMILKSQPDLHHNGTFFSLALIYLINLVIISALLIIASPLLSLRGFTTTWLTHAYTLPERITAFTQKLLEL